MHKTAVESIKTALIEQPLPGEEAQYRMAPSMRHVNFKDFPKLPERNSAVLILLFPFEGLLHTVLIKRTPDKGPHSKQVSFPGGMFEQQDRDLTETALREAQEETGIISGDIAVLGQLTPLHIPVSGTEVLPVVGYIDYHPDFIPNTGEVEAIIETSLANLFDDSVKSTEVLKIKQYEVTSPYYNVKGYHVWGATAMILSEFEAVVKGINFYFNNNYTES